MKKYLIGYLAFGLGILAVMNPLSAVADTSSVCSAITNPSAGIADACKKIDKANQIEQLVKSANFDPSTTNLLIQQLTTLKQSIVDILLKEIASLNTAPKTGNVPSVGGVPSVNQLNPGGVSSNVPAGLDGTVPNIVGVTHIPPKTLFCPSGQTPVGDKCVPVVVGRVTQPSSKLVYDVAPPHDGKVDQRDLTAVAELVGHVNVTGTASLADVNSDGRIDAADMKLVRANFTDSKLVYDVAPPHDGKVDQRDLTAVAELVGHVNVTGTASLADVNSDGRIDAADMKLVRDNFTSSANQIVHSEPVIPAPAPNITITSPLTGSSYTQGQQIPVTYNMNNFPNIPNVQFQLNKGASYPNGPYNPVVTSGAYSPATGTYMFTVPSNAIAGSDYSIMISSDFPDTETSPLWNSNNFTITEPKTLVCPVGTTPNPSGAGCIAISVPTSFNLTINKVGPVITNPNSSLGQDIQIYYGAPTYCRDTCTVSLPAGKVVRILPYVTAGTNVVWSGATCAEGSQSGETCTVTMDQTKNVTATFAFATYTLNVNKAGAGKGSISSSPSGITNCTANCTASYPYERITLTASPDAGTNVTWSGVSTGDICSGITNTCNVLMDRAKSLTATFTAGTAPTLTPAPTVKIGTNGQVQMTGWTTVPGASYYLVYASSDHFVSFRGLGGIITPPQQLSDLTRGVTYTFKVSAVVNGVEGQMSAESTAVTPGSAPTSFTDPAEIRNMEDQLASLTSILAKLKNEMLVR